MRSLLLTLALSGTVVSGTLSTAGALSVRVLVASGPELTIRLPAPQAPASPAPLLPSPPVTPTAPTPENVWTVGVRGGTLTLNGQDAGSTSLYLPPAPGSTVTLAGKLYRGGVLLRVEKGGVQAINVVDVEDYLRGVVAAEMPASWPTEALQAQAVIARTYVAARINPALPYDTCATESCQMYGGVAAEKAGSDAAVRATAGQVVAYGGKPASTYFSSDSGGYTASSAEVWGRDLPYLHAKVDPYSAGGPRSRWRLELGAAQVTDAASRAGVRVGTLRDVRVTRASESGRVQEVTVTGEKGSARLSGADASGFVRALGAASSRASLSGPVGPNTPLVVEGYGSGHGVGLSQYGALGLARQGQGHLNILGFYYPGTTLGVLAGAAGPVGAQLAQAGPLPQPFAPPPRTLALIQTGANVQ
ncbi:SpoIID/LytB domain-containing protein [Deinococcus hopiensis]|uniref:Stage II sporulation protein D n=1 Tax=Deinococcus hopiensis KR-140 TaxID=695939 RepID=A0A1W1VBC7_9DEIO|nr:SpoIID/LytB domain-containing protein [Deinococcus hopiensis]SMB90490.1 stage II sporulation protein D [Deinococcus hopiensis KR-140]